MSDLLLHNLWQIIAGGALLVGFALGVLFGRTRTMWRLRADLMQAQDKAEWERARREQLGRQIEETKNVEREVKEESTADGAAAAGVLRREVERLREELKRTWEGQSEAQQRIQELEARISIMGAKPSRHLGNAVVGDDSVTDKDVDSRQRSTNANVLTLWNTVGEERAKPAANDRGEG